MADLACLFFRTNRSSTPSPPKPDFCYTFILIYTSSMLLSLKSMELRALKGKCMEFAKFYRIKWRRTQIKIIQKKKLTYELCSHSKDPTFVYKSFLNTMIFILNRLTFLQNLNIFSPNGKITLIMREIDQRIALFISRWKSFL